MPVVDLACCLGKIAWMKKSVVKQFYENPAIVDDYSTSDRSCMLQQYILSPSSQYSNDGKSIMICTHCKSDITKSSSEVQRRNRRPPKRAIACGYLIGEPPEELLCLNEVELALVSKVRIQSHIWHWFGGNHHCIKGWHTLFRNPYQRNVANLNSLADSGMQGNIYVILSGPFTTDQQAIARAASSVNRAKVVAAMQWLIKNNIHYKGDSIPTEDEIPLPVVLDHELRTVDSEDVQIENRINLSVIFPDKDLPEPTNGGFKTQEEFRAYIGKHQDGKWESKFVARHEKERIVDYRGDNITQAFPLLFPYGHSGLQEDPAVVKMSKTKNMKVYLGRNRLNTFRKYLRHRKPEFHGGVFNLIVENVILRETIYNTVRIKCNSRKNETQRMGEVFGSFNSEQLNQAVNDARTRNPRQWSANGANAYLRSIHATCQQLPHSNEAVELNRKTYFSYLMKFGMPAIMLTVTPDDSRSFRIIAYAIKPGDAGTLRTEGIDVNSLSDEDIIFEQKICRDARVNHPGLCAEEYERVISLVIKHILGWDESKQTSTGKGLFGKILAWCLATEEQGRKTLHGHFLLWLENWDRLQEVLHCQGNHEMTLKDGVSEAVRLHDSICSARLFQDMIPGSGVLRDAPIYGHQCGSRETRNFKTRRIIPVAVDDQQLHEMRHKHHCDQHQGHIATCTNCKMKFTMDEMVSRSLRIHLSDASKSLAFPDRSFRLFRHIIELQKVPHWHVLSPLEQARRYFASNAMNNVHFSQHTPRCFKKGNECFASLPDCCRPCTIIEFAAVPDTWYDWQGQPQMRYMFRFYPKRGTADSFVNIHNAELTQLLYCNTNVLVGLNGRSVFYCTCYNCKSQQKEERQAFSGVETVMVLHIQKLEENPSENNCIPAIAGFRRLLAGIFTHTKAHIIAAPMAHLMALYGSRFRFSHTPATLSSFGTEHYIMGEKTLMSYVKSKSGQMTPFHACMNYIFRSQDLEDVCYYDFIRKYKIVSKSSVASNSEITTYDFTDDHAQSTIQQSNCH